MVDNSIAVICYKSMKQNTHTLKAEPKHIENEKKNQQQKIIPIT